MNDTEIANEEKENNTPEKVESTDERSTELIETVRERHWEEHMQGNERVGDIFTAQLILCVIMVLIFAVIRFFNESLTEWYIDEFKRMSAGAPEQIIKDAVKFVTDILK